MGRHLVAKGARAKPTRRISVGALAGAILTAGSTGLAQDATSAGAVTTPHPTFHNVSIEWEVSGDDNANGLAQVRYRRSGDAEYRQGLPLFRVLAGENAGHPWSNKHAGSLFGLEPGTTYEIELTLTDPDGGDAAESVTARTRAFPTAATDARTVDVTPDTLQTALADSTPGDILVLASGTYEPFSVQNDGQPGQPIVLRGAEPGGAIVNTELTLTGRSHIHVEDLEIHGRIRANSAQAVVVRGCRIITTEHGIVSYLEGLTDSYIVDNVITGATEWSEEALGVDGDNIGEGVQITGPGNVVAFNRIAGFRDCVSLLEQDEAVHQVSIDIYGNDLDACADDGIEADYAMGNVRVYQNRITHSFMGISSQPSLGGPTYFVRNAMYGVVYEAFKLHNGTVGDVLLHNTVVKSGDAFGVYTEDPVSQLYSRNNLFIGGPGAEYGGYNSGSGDVIDLRSADDTCSLNYDGLGSIGTGTFGGRIGTTAFANQAELSSLTTETDAVLVDLSAFEADVILPVDPFSTPAVPSLLLSTNGSAVDRGIVLPNVNDGFTGDAPDLGAFEVGTKEPIYGPSGTLGEMPSGSGGTENAAAGTAGAATGAAGTSRSVGGASSDTGSGNTTGGASITSAGTSGAEDSASRDEGGCSCRASGDTRTNWPYCVLPLLLLGRRRRRMHPSYRFTRIRWWPWWRFGRFWP